MRGVFDCVFEHPDGSVTILVWKAGLSPVGQAGQLESYTAAARVLFPERKVDIRLV